MRIENLGTWTSRLSFLLTPFKRIKFFILWSKTLHICMLWTGLASWGGVQDSASKSLFCHYSQEPLGWAWRRVPPFVFCVILCFPPAVIPSPCALLRAQSLPPQTCFSEAAPQISCAHLSLSCRQSVPNLPGLWSFPIYNGFSLSGSALSSGSTSVFHAAFPDSVPTQPSAAEAGEITLFEISVYFSIWR